MKPLPDAHTVAGIGAEARLDGKLITVCRVGDLDGDTAAQNALAAIETADATPVQVPHDGNWSGCSPSPTNCGPTPARPSKACASLGSPTR